MAKKYTGPRFTQLYHYLMQSDAWQDLDAVARAVYLDVASRYAGPGTNNGRIPYGVRDAVRHFDEQKGKWIGLPISKDTASRALRSLQNHGFMICTMKGAFDQKKIASEWLLTEYSNDATGDPPRKDFMRWTAPEIQKTVPPIGPDSPSHRTSSPSGRTVTFGNAPYSPSDRTINAENDPPQSDEKDTYSLPGGARPGAGRDLPDQNQSEPTKTKNGAGRISNGGAQ